MCMCVYVYEYVYVYVNVLNAYVSLRDDEEWFDNN